MPFYLCEYSLPVYLTRGNSSVILMLLILIVHPTGSAELGEQNGGSNKALTLYKLIYI